MKSNRQGVGARTRMAFVLAGALLLGVRADAATTPPAHDGPFGLYMGEPMSALGPLTRDQMTYVVANPPKANAQFPVVAVEVYPGTGVCVIGGVGDVIENDPDGTNVRRAADDLSAALTSKYGAPTKVDSCSADDCSAGWADWAAKGNALYGYKWEDAPVAKAQGIGRF